MDGAPHGSSCMLLASLSSLMPIHKAMGLVHRLATRKNEASVNSSTDDENSIHANNEESSKGAPTRMWSSGEKQRQMAKRAVMTTIVAFLISLRFFKTMLFRTEANDTRTFQPRPLMVQSLSLANATRLILEQDPPHFMQERRNRFWINHGVKKEYKEPEQVPEGCVAEAEWMSDHHPSCNNIHETDMADFFFNPQRTIARIDNGHFHRQKFRMIGRGGFRSAFLFHEYNGARRVLKTLLYRSDRGFHPKMMHRMRRDAVASEQLTSSNYIVDIYGYCGMAALVDFSDDDDMLSLFRKKRKPKKDQLFQIAHDVAQSLADAHHFNKEGRATIVHMDIKPSTSFMILRNASFYSTCLLVV